MKNTTRLPQHVATLLLIVWFALLTATFVLVTVPVEGRLARALPKIFWDIREIVYPMFFSPFAM